MDKSAKFWNRMAEGYSKKPIDDEAAYQKKLQVTREYFRPEMEVLEFGCGTGSTAILHAPYVNHIRAIDFSSKMIEIAKAKAQAANISNVSFEVASIETLDVKEKAYDAVLGMSILHLLENRDETIKKVFEILKPGGVFVSSTVCMEGVLKVFKVIGPIGRFFGVLPLLKVFTVRELEASVIDAGFDIDYCWQPASGRVLFLVAKKPVE